MWKIHHIQLGAVMNVCTWRDNIFIFFWVSFGYIDSIRKATTKNSFPQKKMAASIYFRCCQSITCTRHFRFIYGNDMRRCSTKKNSNDSGEKHWIFLNEHHNMYVASATYYIIRHTKTYAGIDRVKEKNAKKPK